MSWSIGAEKWSVEGTRSVINKNIANLMVTVCALCRSLSISGHGWGISSKPWTWDSTASSNNHNGELSAKTGSHPKRFIWGVLNLEGGFYPPYRFKVYSRVREDPERYSARMWSECGHEFPSSDKIYDNLLCFAFKNSAGSHPIKAHSLFLSSFFVMNWLKVCTLYEIKIISLWKSLY